MTLPVLGALTIAIAILASLIFLYARRAAAALSVSRQLALTDSLTGLANRRLLEDTLEEAILASHANGTTVAVLCLDLDGFKLINDRYGHAAGDELLRQVAQRLRAVLRAADIIAPIGGDEFVVVQAAINEAAVERMAERLLSALSEPVILLGEHVPIAASIGIAFANAEPSSDHIRRADKALYEAKQMGGNRLRVAQHGTAGALTDPPVRSAHEFVTAR